MFLVEVVILIVSVIIGLCYQTTKCFDHIYDCAKLLIFGTLLMNYAWLVLGLEGFIWLREILRKYEEENKLVPNQQQQLPQQLIINPQKDGQTAASADVVQSTVEAVQIFDYVTGESQYALIQKTEKSLLTQLGVTLKNTVLLERGRQDAQSGTASKLISQFDHQKKQALANISIKYEDQQEFLKNQNKPHVSIPFKIGDFDKQMGEIIQAEIMSNAFSDHQPKPIMAEIKQDYENVLIAIIFAGVLPLVSDPFFRITNAMVFGVIIHQAVFREDVLTISHLIQIIVVLIGATGMFVLGIFYNYQLLIIGSLIWSFPKINYNLALLVLPIPTLLMFVGI